MFQFIIECILSLNVTLNRKIKIMNRIEYVIHNEKLQEIGLTPLVKGEAKSLIHVSQKDI